MPKLTEPHSTNPKKFDPIGTTQQKQLHVSLLNLNQPKTISKQNRNKNSKTIGK